MSIQQAVACKYLMIRGKYNFKTLSRLISFAFRLPLLAILSFFHIKISYIFSKKVMKKPRSVKL